MTKRLTMILASLVLLVFVIPLSATAQSDDDVQGFYQAINPSSEHSRSWYIARGYDVCDGFSRGLSREAARTEMPAMGLGVKRLDFVDAAASYLCPSFAPSKLLTIVTYHSGKPFSARMLGNDWRDSSGHKVSKTVPWEWDTTYRVGVTTRWDNWSPRSATLECTFYEDGVQVKSQGTYKVRSLGCELTT